MCREARASRSMLEESWRNEMAGKVELLYGGDEHFCSIKWGWRKFSLETPRNIIRDAC